MRSSLRPGLTIVIASTALVCFPSGLLAQSDYGSIKGRLVLGGAEVPVRKFLVEQGKAAKDPEVCGKDAPVVNRELAVDPKTKGVAYGVRVPGQAQGGEPRGGQGPAGQEPQVELDQQNCEFLPYALAIHQDQTLVIKSSDPVNHNVTVRGLHECGLQPDPGAEGRAGSQARRRAAADLVACDIHSWMKAYLMVFDHPFFAVTGEDGSFEIKGVPAGEQNLVVWQEKVGYVNPEKAKGTPVSVKAGEATDVGSVTILPAQVK